MVHFENQYKTDQKESKTDSDGKTFNHQISQKRETRPPKRSVLNLLIQPRFTGSRPSVSYRPISHRQSKYPVGG